MTERWIEEHGLEYAVPSELLDLVASGELHDQSWHNDVSPSFGAYSDEQDLRIWVEHPSEEHREGFLTGGRFHVVLYDEDGSDTEEEFSTDDVTVAIARWREIRKAHGWR